MTRTLPQAPHDNITYLSALAQLLGEDLAHLCSEVETEYTCSAITHPGWFEAEWAEKAALIRQGLAEAQQAAAGSPVRVDRFDPRTLEMWPGEPLERVLESVAAAFAELQDRFEDGQHGPGPLLVAKTVLAALARCTVACRRVEPYRLSGTLRQIR